MISNQELIVWQAKRIRELEDQEDHCKRLGEMGSDNLHKLTQFMARCRTILGLPLRAWAPEDQILDELRKLCQKEEDELNSED